ncbi:MAG: type IV toxin-antitoxin system AbiEi family antitoxin domain-containing protein [Pseudobdellovibrionaceae bacterium]
MGIEKQSKLNQLMRQWPDGRINSSLWLKSEGYGANFIQKYKNNNWIEVVGTGAYKKSGDEVTWASGLECLQKQLRSEVYVGGKTAIELAGRAQYLKMKETKVVMLSNKKEALPSWMKNHDWNVELDYKVKNLFKTNLAFGEKLNGFTTREVDRASITISSPERAYLEYLDELPESASYAESKELMENLITLRPSVVQNLLENCTSIKVKRLFLHFAEKVNHPWYKKINQKKIDLGVGKRVVLKNGVFDKKFNITVPKDESHEGV